MEHCTPYCTNAGAVYSGSTMEKKKKKKGGGRIGYRSVRVVSCGPIAPGGFVKFPSVSVSCRGSIIAITQFI